MDVLKQIKEMCTTLLQAEEIQLYDVSWQQEGRNRILQIAIMREDGSMDIDTCAMMSEIISQKLDELDLVSGEYFLEVCSPGAERELKDDVQIKAALNEYVYVKLRNPQAGYDALKGYLIAVEEDAITISYMDKAVKKQAKVQKDNIALIRLSVKI
ncbi:MAG: ribosome maturation factor RimP [Longicatena sp.]|nr:ribosome maturation factor RimP [Longicatena sp.]